MIKSSVPYFALLLSLFTFARAQNIDIPGPRDSGRFGTQVTSLPNGNFVVTDPSFDTGPGMMNVGAVYVYDGASGALIDSMIGEKQDDNIGSGGVSVLTGSDFLVISPGWDGPSVTNAGAVTKCDGAGGCPATVNAANSLTGSRTDDLLTGSVRVMVLSSGNYLLITYLWDNGAAAANAGAVTWCDKTAGCPLTISAADSLIGATAGDRVGAEGVTLLTNGNYVVQSRAWHNGALANAGAVTFGNGQKGVSGEVSPGNSLIGSHAGDFLGNRGIYALPSGSYVVASSLWDNGTLNSAGAVTFGDGNTGVSGPIVSFNSLIGLTAGDQLGSGGVTVLTNGNYVVASPEWSSPGAQEVGAATWGSGTTGVVGAVSAGNSLVGTWPAERVSGTGIASVPGVVALTNGNYVVISQFWTGGTGTSAGGAVTWGDGATGIVGTVQFANSLYGSPGDGIGSLGVTPLTNGNYVVRSPAWKNGAQTQAGAATLGNGTTGATGLVTPANSLTGSTSFDRVSDRGVIALSNGNYVVLSQQWDRGGITDAGAATWGNGTTGITGPVSDANSLVGSSPFDLVGTSGAALTNGNYVVSSPEWNDGSNLDSGAATWGNGAAGVRGEITPQNSLTGAGPGQEVGSGGITPLTNGNYLVSSPEWDAAGATEAGAVTWANGQTGLAGQVTPANSLVGSTQDDRVGEASYAIALANGNYIVHSPRWDNSGVNSAGAFTRGNGTLGTRGVINTGNSITGLTAQEGSAFSYSFDMVNNQIIVGKPGDNLVTLYRMQANVSVSGRVTDSNGTPIRNALVSLTASGGQRITAQTGSLGFYLLENVPTGQAYTASVSAKRYRFASPQSIFVDADLTGVDFTARLGE
jgi:Repeat of unknown function (DUF5650)/Carboxypeptidase regulatory-like domain